MMPPLHWQSRGLLAWAWLPASLLYHAMVRLRTSLARTQHLAVPVLCVGNNTVGGAGKTPTALLLCTWLSQAGYHPHVISRGYKGRYVGTVKVDPDVHIAEEVGDEPLLLARHVPCWVSGRRLHAARAAIRDGADVIVMDDGLQNPTLHKDFCVAVFDAQAGIGNGFMLPAGPCREPLGRTMKKADMALLIGGEGPPSLQRKLASCGKPVFHGALLPDEAAQLQGVHVHPFAGIGNPDKFFATVRAMGGVITLESRFPDHHYYTGADLERLKREAGQHSAKLVTTEKDAVKLPREFLQDTIVVKVALKIDQEEQMKKLLLDTLVQHAAGERA